jgi:hypothetical protein
MVCKYVQRYIKYEKTWITPNISHNLLEMSEDEYTSEDESEYDSEYETDADTCVTFTSLEGAMAAMYEQFASLDAELGEVTQHITTLEKPVATVAVATFVQPRVLESAPFRQTKFHVRSTAKHVLSLPAVATFSELCKAIRIQLRERREEAESMWETTNFLEILQKLNDVVE